MFNEITISKYKRREIHSSVYKKSVKVGCSQMAFLLVGRKGCRENWTKNIHGGEASVHISCHLKEVKFQ